jgi:uncharacterized protein (DUF1684 family)
MTGTPHEALDLLDWKRRIFELYAYVRASAPEEGWRAWRNGRDHLFKTHPQSPLPRRERDRFDALDLYEYDAAARVLGDVEAAPEQELRIPSSTGEEMVCRRVGRVRFRLREREHTLDLFWIGGYGGGLFLPFRDATSRRDTYGAGRYLYDTVKGADLGTDGRRLVLDFNFSYNPSCAYDPRWSCPLAPPANLLDAAVEAGERTPRAGIASRRET